MWTQKITNLFVFALYHNSITIYDTKCLPLLQNLMSFLLKFTETGYWFRIKNISENITRCNLPSHG